MYSQEELNEQRLGSTHIFTACINQSIPSNPFHNQEIFRMKKSLTLLSFLALVLVGLTAQAQLRTGKGDFFNITRNVEQTRDSVTFVTDTVSVYDMGGGVQNFIDRDSVVIMFVQNRFKIVNNMLTSNLFDYANVRISTSSPGMTLGRQAYNNVVTAVGATAVYGTDNAVTGRSIGLRPVYRRVGNIATSSPFFPKDPNVIRQVLTFQVLQPTGAGDGIQLRNVYFKPNINNLTGLAVPPDTTKDTLRAYHVIGNVANLANAGDVVSQTDLGIFRLLPGTTQVIAWVNDSAQAVDAGEYIGSFGDYSRGRYFLGDDGLPVAQSQTLQLRPGTTRTFGLTTIVNPDYGMMVDGFPPERNPIKFTNLYQALAPYWYNENFPNVYPAFPGDAGSNPNPEFGQIPPYRVGEYAVTHNPYQPGLVSSAVDTLRFFDGWGNRTWDRMTQPKLKALLYTKNTPQGEDATIYLKGYQAADDTLRQYGQVVFRRLAFTHADVGSNPGGVEDSVRIVAEATVYFDGQGGTLQGLNALPDTSGGFPKNYSYSIRATEALLDNSTRTSVQWQVDPNRDPVDPAGLNHLPPTGLKITVRPNIPRVIDIESRDAWKNTADRRFLRMDIKVYDGYGNTVDDNEPFKFELSPFGHLTFTNPPSTVAYRLNGTFDSLVTYVPNVVVSGNPGADSGRVAAYADPNRGAMGMATRVFQAATGSNNAGAYRIRVRASYTFNDRYSDLRDPLKYDPNPGPGFAHTYLIKDGSPNNNWGVWFGPGTGYNAKLGRPTLQTTAMDSTDVYWNGDDYFFFPVNPRVEVVTGTGDALVVGSVGPFTRPGAPKQIYDKLYVRLTNSHGDAKDIAPYFNATDRQQNKVWVELPDNPPLVDAFNAGLTTKVFFGSVSPNVAWRGAGSPVPYDNPSNPAGFDPAIPVGLPNAGQILNAELVLVKAGQGLPGIQGDIPALQDYNAVRFYLRAPKNVTKLSLAGTDVIRLRAHLNINTNIPNVGDFSLTSGFAEVSIIPDVVQNVEIFKSWGKPAGTQTPMEGWSPITANDALAAWYSTGTPRDAAEGSEFYRGYFFRAIGAVPPTTGIAFPTPLEPVNRGIGGFLASDVSLDGDCTAPIPMDTVMVSEHNQQMRIIARLLDQYNNPVGGRLVKFYIESETLPITLPKTQLQNNAQRGGFGEFGRTFVSDDTLKRSTIGDTATAGWVTAYYVSGRVAHQLVRIALTPDTLAFDLSPNGRNLGEGTAVGESRRGYAPRVIVPLYLTSGPTVRVQIYPYTAAATSPVPLPTDLISMQSLEHVSIYPDSRGAGYAPYFHGYSANPFFVEQRATHLGRMANSNIRPYIVDTLNLTDADPQSVNSVTAGRTVALLAREYDRFGNLVELQLKPPYDRNNVGNVIDTARIKFRAWGPNFGTLPAPYNAPGGTIMPAGSWTRDEFGPMRKARYRHTQISNLVSGVHINQTSYFTALEFPTPKTAGTTMYFEAWADAWPDLSRPGATDIIRDTCRVVSVTKQPTRFDILRAGQEYLQSQAGRWIGVGEPENRSIGAAQIGLPAGADPIQHDFSAVGVDNIMISQAYKRNVSNSMVGKYLVVNPDNVPVDRDGDPLYLDKDATSINPNFERHPASGLPVFQKLDVYNNLSPLTAPNNAFNVINDNMIVKLGYTIPGVRSDNPTFFFDITMAGGGNIYDLNPLTTAYGTLNYQGIGWHIAGGRAQNQRPTLLRVTPIWENNPPTGGAAYDLSKFTGVNTQPGQTRVYGSRLYADSVYTYTSPSFGGAKNNSVRGELMGTFTDRGRPGSYAPQTNGGDFDRVTRLGVSSWGADDYTIAGLNGMARTRTAIGVWGGQDANGNLFNGDFNRRVLTIAGAFGISSGTQLPIAPGAFVRLIDSTAEQVVDLRVVDPTLTDKAGQMVDDTCSYDQGKWTVVRKAQRIANNFWHLDDTYWRGGDGIEDGILGPNVTAQSVSELPYANKGVPSQFGNTAPEAAATRSFFGTTASRKLLHTFVVVPYRIAYLSIFPSSFDPAQGMFDNTRLPLGILPVQADIDTLPRVNLGIYPDGMHDGSDWEMFTRLYGQIRHGATDAIPNSANTPYARPDTIFRDFRYVYNVTPYDRYGNMNARDTMFVQIGARFTDWSFTNLEPSGTLMIRGGGNWFGAKPINVPDGLDNTNFRQDTLRIFNPFPQANLRNEYVGIKPDDKRLTLAVGDPGLLKIPHGLLPANVVSSRPVWVKQAFAPAPFVLSTTTAQNRTLFRLDRTAGCQPPNSLADDILRLQWTPSRWNNVPGKNNPNDTVKYEWYGIIDSVGTGGTGQLVVSMLSDNLGVSPTLTVPGDQLRALLFRPNVQPQPNNDSLVMRVKWFVRAFNKAGLETYSDTAGATIRNNPPPTPALIVSINRAPENPPTAVQPVDNATISALGPTSQPVPVIWTAASDRNINKGILIGGFKVYNGGSQTWIDDPSGRTVDTLTYMWVGEVVRTFPAGKGAPVGTIIVKDAGSTPGTQLTASDLDVLFAGFDTNPSSTSADSVIIRWMVYVKDFNQTDNLPMEDVTFRYDPNGTIRPDTALWSRFGCRPHELASRWFNLNLTKLDKGGVEISATAADPDIDKMVGEEVEFTLTAKDANGNIIRDWNIKGVPVTLTLKGSTANTDSSSRSWNADQLGYTWAVITNNGTNLTQAGPNDFVIDPSAFVDGVAKIKVTHTKAERGIQIDVSPILAGLNQTSAKMNFNVGGITNYLVELTSAQNPVPSKVYKMRLYEIIVSPRDRFLNVSNAQIQTKFTARFPGEFDNTIPGLSDIFSGSVFITGPTNYFVASRIARVKGAQELQWIRAYNETNPAINGQTDSYEVLDHAPNTFPLTAPADATVLKLITALQTETFTWTKAVPQDPYTDIVVSALKPNEKFTDVVRYNVVFVDSTSLTRAERFESDGLGMDAKFTSNHGQLQSLVYKMSGTNNTRQYSMYWFVEAYDDLYTTKSTPPNADNRPGYLLTIVIDKILGNETVATPKEFALGQNYPNPFNPTTTISYSLPKSAPVSIVVYDLLGTPVKTLVNETKDAGSFKATWDATNDLGQQMPSGNYIIKMVAGDFTQTRKMTLLK